MLNPIGGQGVCCTIAENEDIISKPWLWMAQKHARAAIVKKSPELAWLRKPTSINKSNWQKIKDLVIVTTNQCICLLYSVGKKCVNIYVCVYACALRKDE